ncbi:MAG: sulfotransferase [Caldilinea sp. CFX5]|nr:sulfotransferase [Caldilinea sp. CFX5]
MKTDNQQPIFVVGAPRSGTTLLAAMLAAHSRLSCGPETRFFHFLVKSNPASLLEEWPRHAVDYLYSIELIEAIPEHYGLSRKQIHAYLQAREPHISAILAALTEQFMHKENKGRWVEKSPEHLLCLDSIRYYFPQSPVVRIIRDPRDVALSLIKTPWAPQDYLEAVLFWRNYDEQSQKFFQTDANSYTLSYENLLTAPAYELRQLCIFLGEDYENQMLDTSKSAVSVVTEQETWKGLVHRPVDPSRLQVWKRELSREQNQITEALLGDRLCRYGYECTEKFERTASVYPSVDLLLRHRSVLAQFVKRGIRFWRTPSDREIDCVVYIGEPDNDKWLRYQKPARWWDALSIMKHILVNRLAQREIYWLHEPAANQALGYCGQALARLLQFTGARS